MVYGVGMSQWGAYEMALEGHSYDAILRQLLRKGETFPRQVTR